ncbi:MAG: hypothetical protein RL628_399, partial [Actinomycetota bacterium]
LTQQFSADPDSNQETSIQGAAFFDLDRTMIPGSSVFTLAGVAWKSGHLSTKQLLHDAWEALTFRTSGATDGKTLKVRQRILGAIKGQDSQTLQQDSQTLQSLASEVIPKIVSQVRPETLEIIRSHHRVGRPTYIVSASPAEIVEPLAAALGMTGGIGTRSEIVNGRYTGEIIGSFCYGSGKVVAIMELARDLGYDLSQSYSYSDAASDLPMLESTKYSFAVNPDAELEKIARERSYPIVRFSGMRVRSQSRFRYSPQKLWLAIGLCVSILAIGRKDTRKAAQALLSRS